jgi:hypothetical protein
MLTEYITCLLRVHWVESMYVVVDLFMYFPVIYSEYGITHVTKLSSGEIYRVHEEYRFNASEWEKIPFITFEIECGSGFTGRDFT